MFIFIIVLLYFSFLLFLYFFVNFSAIYLNALYLMKIISNQGLFISSSGVRPVWLRHDLEYFKKRLTALETKVAQDTYYVGMSKVLARFTSKPLLILIHGWFSLRFIQKRMA